ncbi:hypothetical protein MMC30_009198 [Trapelia coarctata]|nr:hypothetical protein [Trapelia coarctata]
MASTNYSLYAIPASLFLALLPHLYAVQLIKSANNGRWDNSHPRSTAYNDKLQKTVPNAIFRKFERGEAAHKNGMENLVIFSTAVILGNMANLPAGTLNTVAGGYLALRVLYNVAYIQTTANKYSYMRTGIWASSILLCMYQMVRAANVFASRSDV